MRIVTLGLPDHLAIQAAEFLHGAGNEARYESLSRNVCWCRDFLGISWSFNRKDRAYGRMGEAIEIGKDAADVDPELAKGDRKAENISTWNDFDGF